MTLDAARLIEVEKSRLCGRIGPLTTGMVGVKIDAYTVYPEIRGLIFADGGNIFPGVWLDPVGFGMPMVVGFEQDSERETFCALLDDARLKWVTWPLDKQQGDDKIQP